VQGKVIKQEKPTEQEKPLQRAQEQIPATQGTDEKKVDAPAAVLATQEKKTKEDQQAKKKKLPTYHIVKKGETLAKISNKYGIDIATLKSANNLKSDKLYPNMRLKIVKSEG